MSLVWKKQNISKYHLEIFLGIILTAQDAGSAKNQDDMRGLGIWGSKLLIRLSFPSPKKFLAFKDSWSFWAKIVATLPILPDTAARRWWKNWRPSSLNSLRISNSTGIRRLMVRRKEIQQFKWWAGVRTGSGIKYVNYIPYNGVIFAGAPLARQWWHMTSKLFFV